jgi:hypothetical protein
VQQSTASKSGFSDYYFLDYRNSTVFYLFIYLNSNQSRSVGKPNGIKQVQINQMYKQNNYKEGLQ